MSLSALKTKRGLAALTMAATCGLTTLAGAGIANAAGGAYNLRTGPGTQYPVVGTVMNPDCRTIDHIKLGGPDHVINEQGPWFHINGGWVYDDDWCI